MSDLGGILYQGKQIVEFIKNSTEKEILEFFLELRETILKLRAENQGLKEKIRQHDDDESAAGKVVQYGNSSTQRVIRRVKGHTV